MKKIIVLILLVLFCGILSSCSAGTGSPNAQMTEIQKGTNIKLAKKIVLLMSQKKYDDIKKYYDDYLKSQSNDQLKVIWESITAENGPFIKEYNTRSEISQGYEVVYVTCKFKKGFIDVILQFSAPGKLSIIDHIITYNVTVEK